MPKTCGLRHECGLFGVYSNEVKSLAGRVFFGLFALQHRGQESAGIAVAHDNKITYHKDMGLVAEVFNNDNLKALPEGNIAIGHVRYATSLSRSIVNAQPIVASGRIGKIAVMNNGRLVNARELRDKLIDEGIIFHSVTDSEVIAALINKYTDKDIINGVIETAKQLKGGFAVVLNTVDCIIALRDRNGLMPLILGKYLDDYIVASESSAIEAVGGKVIRDIAPGEIIVIDKIGLRSYYMDGIAKRSCIFEMIYISRCDSVIDGKLVYDSRFLSGRHLARLYNIQADAVSGAPDSGIVAARGYSHESGIPYMDVLSKNRYIGRSFIQPEQIIRERSVKIKLNGIRSNIEGKRIILVDDSIVRGTTCKKTVALLRSMGAKEVHLMVASPPVKYPCHYGVDISDSSELIAAKYDHLSLVKYIGADSINYLPVDDIIECAGVEGDRGFCAACFTGDYPIKVD